jgi:hypothetical protein
MELKHAIERLNELTPAQQKQVFKLCTYFIKLVDLDVEQALILAFNVMDKKDRYNGK